MRKKIVAGNWKMNLNRDKAHELLELIKSNSYPDDELLLHLHRSIWRLFHC